MNYDAMPTSICQPIIVLDPDFWYKFIIINSADPDQLASGANWSGSALFAKAEYIWAQQDQG